MTISDILKQLPKEDRTLLNYAFEHGLSQYVEYTPGKFVGVNIAKENFKNLTHETVAGNWSKGEIR